LIEKVDLPFEGGGVLKAHFRIPIYGDLPAPALILFSGSDEPKEWLTPFEEAALKRGIATLSVDLPGFGESQVAGAKLQSLRSLKQTVTTAADFLQSRPGIRGDRLGSVGLNLGGLFSHLAGGLDPRISVTASVGAPLDPAAFIHKIAAARRMKLGKWFGIENPKDAEELFRSFEIIHRLGRLESPALLVHGMKDEIVPVKEARGFVSLIKGSSELKLVPEADHLCSERLERQVMPYLFNWLSERLGAMKIPPAMKH
jgi:alpha-beta hydrolase superfamily lysophospholipase